MSVVRTASAFAAQDITDKRVVETLGTICCFQSDELEHVSLHRASAGRGKPLVSKNTGKTKCQTKERHASLPSSPFIIC